jgi:hypothetical protein
LSAAVFRNHMSYGLGFWYDDRTMNLVVHKGLTFCTGLLCIYFEGPR